MKYFNKNRLDLNDKRMRKIIHGVYGITSKLKIGKKYTLKQIMDIAHPDWWKNNLPPYDARSAGVTFINLVNEGWFPELAANVKHNSSNQYIRIK